ncbi:MAG: NUDIX domain-containing protein [Cyanobacteria bacterium J06632_22]
MIKYRTAARLVLLNAAQEVLLLRHTIGYKEPYWSTPGGGLEPGETAEQAARREAKEELGAEQVTLQPLWTGEAHYTYKGQKVIQAETFFWVTQYSAILGAGIEAEHQLEGITDIRWWSIAALEASSDLIFPSDLSAKLNEFCL